MNETVIDYFINFIPQKRSPVRSSPQTNVFKGLKVLSIPSAKKHHDDCERVRVTRTINISMRSMKKIAEFDIKTIQLERKGGNLSWLTPFLIAEPYGNYSLRQSKRIC
jgi:hypothetical protein